jgi:hypothetical protein
MSTVYKFRTRPEKSPVGMVVPFGLTTRTIYGGPYVEKPIGMFGIKMAREVKGFAHAYVPVEDYHVPEGAQVYDLYYALRFALQALANGRDVYVGCMGGVGRTGLFMSVLVRALGHSLPVDYVRKFYNPHAVETAEQQAFVMSFDLEPLKGDVRRAKVGAAMVSLFRKVGITYQYHAPGF